MRIRAQHLFLTILVVLFLGILSLLAAGMATPDWFVRHDKWLRDFIRQQPVTSFAASFLICFLLSLIPGTSGKSVVLGWYFGVLAGVLIVNSALVAAAVVTFLLSRHYLRAAVEARFGVRLNRVRKRMARDGAHYLLTLRLAHAPFSLTNYTAGAATHVSLLTFWWTTQLGLLPGNIVFAFAGARLPTVERLVQQGPLELLDVPMMAVLVVTVFVPWLTRKAVRRFAGR